MDKILDRVNNPDDVKKLSSSELLQLSCEIREFLISNISKTGGHLASNLGVVELTIALHKVFNSPKDKIIFDVGHQSYVHKILTGRKDKMITLRQFGGISGFPKPSESEYDAFIGGHSSTSVSAAFGLACADSLSGGDNYSIAVIGDGALTGGLAFEALNNAGRSKEKIIVVLNDNEMSISQSVGAIAKYLSTIRSNPFYFKLKDITFNILSKIPLLGKWLINIIQNTKTGLKESLYHVTMFEDMGFTYLGPIDGHNMQALLKLLERAKILKRPVLLHIYTKKGKGCAEAENRPDLFHGISGIDPENAEANTSKTKTFSDAFGEAICEIAEKNEKICAITAAMSSGTGLTEFADKFSNRFYDVGIAEEHAVTFSAGLAASGLIPVVAVYSTFLQRAYDQIIHDVALQKAKVVFAVDRAGIVGEDGDTHQGIFDVSFFNHIPGIVVFSPSNCFELKTMLNKAVYDVSSPVAIRYPRGGEHKDLNLFSNEYKNFEIIYPDDKKDILLISYGRQIFEVIKAADELKKTGLNVSVLKINMIKPIDEKIFEIIKKYRMAFFIEESCISGGIGEKIACNLVNSDVKIYLSGITGFVQHGTYKELLKLLKLDHKSIVDYVNRECNN